MADWTRPCPHCHERIGLPLGAELRCPHCTKCFYPGDTRPTPEEFRLTQKQVESFMPHSRGSLLPVVLGLLGAAATLNIRSETDASFWLRAATGFAAGFAAGAAVGRVYAALYQWIMRRSRSFPDFERYERALVDHNQYLSAVREELERQQSLRREQLRKKRREKEEQLRRSFNYWKNLDGRSFERELARHYKSKGYQVIETGGTGDQGVDLVLVKRSKRIIVQCKAHRSYISPSVVRDLYGTLMHHRAQEAWLISTADYLKGAKAFAKGKPIRLLTIKDVLEGAETSDVEGVVVVDSHRQDSEAAAKDR